MTPEERIQQWRFMAKHSTSMRADGLRQAANELERDLMTETSDNDVDDKRVRNCLVVSNEELADAIHHSTDLNEANDFGDEEEMVKHISNAHSILGQALEEYQSE